MSCDLSSGYSVPCKGIGGLKSLYIGVMDPTVTYNYNIYNEISEIIDIQNYYNVELEAETASFSQEEIISVENNTSYFDKKLEFVVYGLNQALIEFINTLGRGYWSIIFVDQMDNTWLFETKSMTNVTAMTLGPGKLLSDINGAIITLETKGERPSNLIVSGVYPYPSTHINFGFFMNRTGSGTASFKVNLTWYDIDNSILATSGTFSYMPTIPTNIISITVSNDIPYRRTYYPPTPSPFPGPSSSGMVISIAADASSATFSFDNSVSLNSQTFLGIVGDGSIGAAWHMGPDQVIPRLPNVWTKTMYPNMTYSVSRYNNINWVDVEWVGLTAGNLPVG